MGPERLLDFAARQLQTDANRWPPQGAIEAKLPQSGLKMRHPKGKRTEFTLHDSDYPAQEDVPQA